MKTIKIAVDGPAGAGKSSVSKKVASALGLLYIDTGAMYRAVALYVLNCGRDTKSQESVVGLLDSIDIDMVKKAETLFVYLNGADVTDKIRTPEVSVGASDVAVIPEVRLKLVDLQRKIASQQSVIMDGRDIGTYVLPDADVKVFLTADVRVRAERRRLELMEKGQNVPFDEVLSDMVYRDKNDSERKFAPLKCADDAHLVDTSQKSFEEVVNEITSIIKKVTGYVAG